jgi:hypothetical protein
MTTATLPSLPVTHPKPATQAGPNCAVSTGSLAGGESGERYFIDRDLFLIYVEDRVNTARAESGLDTISRAAATHLFDVIDSRRYRQQDGRQENKADQT